MKKIKVKLNTNGLKKAIRELEFYRDSLEMRVMRAAEQIALLAVDVVQGVYGSAVAVSLIPTENRLGYTIEANGRAVGFLEFGAGLMTDEGHPFAENAPFDVREGSYSEDHAMQYYTYGYWWYGGKRYYFVAPRRGLYEGSTYIRDHAVEVIKRSFT